MLAAEGFARVDKRGGAAGGAVEGAGGWALSWRDKLSSWFSRVDDLERTFGAMERARVRRGGRRGGAKRERERTRRKARRRLVPSPSGANDSLEVRVMV